MRRATRCSAIPYTDRRVVFTQGTRFANSVEDKKRLLRRRGPVLAAWPGERATHLFRVIKRRALVALR
jgi:hypothetical protein